MAEISAFLFAAIGTLGYAVTYNISKKLLPLTAVTGGVGWMVFCCFPTHPVYGCFFAALSVGILGEIFARKFKDAATLFILPGILPLVPGAKMYRMTLALLDKNFSTAATLGIEALSLAGSIAIALITVTSFTRMLFKTLNLWKEKRERKKADRENEQKKKRAAEEETGSDATLFEGDPEPSEIQQEDQP